MCHIHLLNLVSLVYYKTPLLRLPLVGFPDHEALASLAWEALPPIWIFVEDTFNFSLEIGFFGLT